MYGPEFEEFREKQRQRGIHGEAAARMLVQRERYELPETTEDLEQLIMLVVERGAFPQRLGQAGSLYADVIMGWRTVGAAVRILEDESTRETAPPGYCARLARLAIELGSVGRAEDGIVLARLVWAAVDAVYEEGSPEWTDSGCAFVQAALTRADEGDPLVTESASVVDRLLAIVPVVGTPRELARVYSLTGQHFWIAGMAEKEEEDDLDKLRLAEANLAKAADLREGAERGRTLATLAQVSARLYHHRLIAADLVADAARESLALTDREDRPRQWLSARRILREVDPAFAPATEANAQELLEIRNRHGEVVAQDCLFLEALDLEQRGRQAAARSLLESLWEQLHVSQSGDQLIRERLLGLAAHTLDTGVVACRDVDQTAAKRLFKQTQGLHGRKQLAARVHLAMHTLDPVPPGSWAITRAPELVGRVKSRFEREALTFGLAVIHTRQRDATSASPAFRFRCSLLAASELAEIDLTAFVLGALEPGVAIAAEWVSGISGIASQSAQDAKRFELRGMVDGCLHSAAYLDAALADPGREWLLGVGRLLSHPARASPISDPRLALAHGVAFKGALTTELLMSPGPWHEIDGLRQSRRQIAELERIEPNESPVDVAPDVFDEEFRRCAWLHTGDQASGVTVAQRLRNSQSRYDEMLLRTLAYQRTPLGSAASPALALESVTTLLGSNTVLVDTFLGVDEGGRYATFMTVLSAELARRYTIRHETPATTAYRPLADPDVVLLLDGLGPRVAEVRATIQEPAGPRPLSRAAASALAGAAHELLGELSRDLQQMLTHGYDHVVFCPHGPLAFLPFHLLPLDAEPLARDWTVTTIPSVAAILPRTAPRAAAEVPLGIVASPNGGMPFGFPGEPRLGEQAMELGEVMAGSELLTNGGATPEAAMALITRSQYVHIAAHGSAFEQVPAYHCIYLDPADNADGRLFAHKIMRADLGAVELVTLCACETALGRADPAGNIRGLPTALMEAGVGTVIATLWPVSAEPAIHFFTQVYRRLNEGVDKLSAFRAAQLETRGRFPRYVDWGAFSYIGSWR